MADTKISALPVVTTSAAADSIPIVQGGVTSRIHPGPAGGLDANTVSAYGIGATAAFSAADCNNNTKGGLYYTDTARANDPFPGSQYGIMLVLPSASGLILQVAFSISTLGYCKSRLYNGATWSAWVDGITYFSDGNGGQAPQPKWNTLASTKDGMTIGQEWIEDITSGSNVIAPVASGLYMVEFLTYGTNLSAAPASKTYSANGNSGVQGTMSGGNGRIKWIKVT